MANEARIRAFMLPVLTLSSDYDPDVDSTIEAPELADWPEVTSSAHLPVWINRDGVGGNDPYLRYIAAHTPGMDTATIGAAPENVVMPYAVTVGTVAHHGSTPRDFPTSAQAFITGSDIALNAGTPTNWQDFPTIAGTRDLLLPCFAGDVVTVGASMRVNNPSTVGFFDVWSDPDGTPYSWASRGTPVNTHFGIQAWSAPAISDTQVGGGIQRQITAAEIVSDVLTLRMKYRLNAAATKDLILNSGVGLNWEWNAINLGPAYEAPVFPAS